MDADRPTYEETEMTASLTPDPNGPWTSDPEDQGSDQKPDKEAGREKEPEGKKEE